MYYLASHHANSNNEKRAERDTTANENPKEVGDRAILRSRIGTVSSHFLFCARTVMKRAELGLLEVLGQLECRAGGNVSWGAKDSSNFYFWRK
jgi:hypothetical protein